MTDFTCMKYVMDSDSRTVTILRMLGSLLKENHYRICGSDKCKISFQRTDITTEAHRSCAVVQMTWDCGLVLEMRLNS